MVSAIRLEAAVERLAEALSRPRPATAAPADMVPRAEVEALTARLETTIARLKAALAEQDDAAEED